MNPDVFRNAEYDHRTAEVRRGLAGRRFAGRRRRLEDETTSARPLDRSYRADGRR